MRLIEDWQNKNLRCYCCGTTKSVKYVFEMVEFPCFTYSQNVYLCNKCAWYYMTNDERKLFNKEKGEE